MARSYKKPSVVSGLSVSQILKMPESKFKEYSLSDQRAIISRLVSAGNKRLRTFEKYGVESPTVIDVMESGGKFSTKGKTDEGALLKELTRARSFLRNPMSTLKEWRKIESKMFESLQERGYDVDREQMATLANVLGKLSREHKLTTSERYNVIYQVESILGDNEYATADDITRTIEKQLDKIYKSTQEDYINASTSDFMPVK